MENPEKVTHLTVKRDDGEVLNLSLKDIIEERIAEYSFYRQGYLYYNLLIGGQYYSFPIEVSDLGGATVSKTEKAITLMRYIRKALEGGSLVRAK